MNVDSAALRLYAVTDRTWLNGSTLASQVALALQNGTTFLQLREKDLSFENFVAEAKELKEIAARFSVPFIINDDIQVMLAADADGVHVGQHDMEAGNVRALIGEDKILGVSVQTVSQALNAERAGADYLGVGAVFSTSTKEDADDVSFGTLSDICKSVSIPVVAIGGISEENALSLCGSGIDGIAVVSAVFAQPDIAEAAKRLRLLSDRIAGETLFAGLQGAIFDMDGTLLDSMYIWETVGERYLRSLGKAPKDDLREALRPMSLQQASVYLHREYDLPFTPAEITAQIHDRIRAEYEETAPVKPFVREFLCSLKEAGVKMAVATATDIGLTKAALSRLGILSYFSCITTCAEVGAGKDTPAVFLAALNALGTDKRSTLVFEDALHAAQSAKAAGFPVAGIADGSAKNDEAALRKLCDFFYSSFAEVIL